MTSICKKSITIEDPVNTRGVGLFGTKRHFCPYLGSMADPKGQQPVKPSGEFPYVVLPYFDPSVRSSVCLSVPSSPRPGGRSHGASSRTLSGLNPFFKNPIRLESLLQEPLSFLKKVHVNVPLATPYPIGSSSKS